MSAEDFCRLLETGAANLPGKLPNGRAGKAPGDLPNSRNVLPTGNLPLDQFGKLSNGQAGGKLPSILLEGKALFGQGMGNLPNLASDNMPGSDEDKPPGNMPGNLPSDQFEAKDPFCQEVGNLPNDDPFQDLPVLAMGKPPDSMPGNLPSIRLEGKTLFGQGVGNLPSIQLEGKDLLGQGVGNLPKDPYQDLPVLNLDEPSGNMPGKLPNGQVDEQTVGQAGGNLPKDPYQDLPILNLDEPSGNMPGNEERSGNGAGKLPNDQEDEKAAGQAVDKLPNCQAEFKEPFGLEYGNLSDDPYRDLPVLNFDKPSGSMPGNLPNAQPGKLPNDQFVAKDPFQDLPVLDLGEPSGSMPDAKPDDDSDKLPKLTQAPNKTARPDVHAWPTPLLATSRAKKPGKWSGKLFSGILPKGGPGKLPKMDSGKLAKEESGKLLPKEESGKLPKEESGKLPKTSKPDMYGMMDELTLTSGNMPGKLPPIKVPKTSTTTEQSGKLPTKLPKSRSSSSGPPRKPESKPLQEIGLPGTSGLYDLPMGQSIARVERIGGGSEEEAKPRKNKWREEQVMLFQKVNKDKKAKKGGLAACVPVPPTRLAIIISSNPRTVEKVVYFPFVVYLSPSFHSSLHFVHYL
ncbi:hypothetical protein CAEBREN_24522 [Caenorhabditis brenneri]|uniref:Uncharacterized protein n=1 Tax=Caenorhabditis brenneri TaxID=135651 RepID=G0N2Z5_CAEBE|nr:hypothetical protein CAEBREN_24522 [Caenorhabditis brenneri]